MQYENFYNYRCKPEILSVNFGRKIFTVCKRGRGHIENKTVCQDYCAAEKISDNIFVMTVADGHGGEKYIKSDIGSKKACETLIELVKKYSPLGANQIEKKLCIPTFKTTLIDKWRLKVLENYKTENPETKEKDRQIIEKYGTTLLFAVITNFHIILGQIGEGAIIQGGSVVHGEIPPCAIAGGNPAKVFKYRDIEHYNKLKNEKKFFLH